MAKKRAKKEIQFGFHCYDPTHPKDLDTDVWMEGPLEFVLGAARNHLKGHTNARVNIWRK